MLNAAFAIAGSLPGVSSNGSTSGSSGSGSSGSNGGSSGGGNSGGGTGHSSNVGAIAGGVVGGVGGVALIALAICFYRKRRAASTGEAKVRATALSADPFPPGSSESSWTQSRFDRKLATEGGSHVPTLTSRPASAAMQTTSSPAASSLSLLNSPRPRVLADETLLSALQPNREPQPSAADARQAAQVQSAEPPVAPLSPIAAPVQFDPQAIHGIIGQLQGMLRDQQEPPPEYIPRDA